MTASFRKFMRQLRPNVWSLSGNERESKAPIGVLYVGHMSQKDYIARLIFHDEPKETYHGKVWLWAILGTRETARYNCPLAILEIGRFLEILFKNRGFHVPCWVNGEVELSVLAAGILENANVKKDLRRIRKNGFDYIVTGEQKQFVDFYHQMYLPHMAHTYGKEALLHSLEDVMKRIGKSELMLIRRGEELIAGDIIAYEKDCPRFLCMGVRDGNPEYVKAGALAAIYYFRFVYLGDRGYRKVSLGGSRSFLEDGVLQYKRKWGMRVSERRRGGTFVIQPLNGTAGVKAFLRNNPFLCKEKGRLVATLFVDESDEMVEGKVMRWHTKYALPGVAGLTLYALGGKRIEIPDHLRRQVSVACSSPFRLTGPLIDTGRCK